MEEISQNEIDQDLHLDKLNEALEEGIEPKEDWEEKLLNMCREEYSGSDGYLIIARAVEEVLSLIRQTIAKERAEVTEKHIKLSDDIEFGEETKFEEWKAFKKFRNKLRDELKTMENQPQPKTLSDIEYAFRQHFHKKIWNHEPLTEIEVFAFCHHHIIALLDKERAEMAKELESWIDNLVVARPRSVEEENPYEVTKMVMEEIKQVLKSKLKTYANQ